MTLCSVDGCEEPKRARGWCKRHYAQWRKHGDPLAKAKGGRPKALVPNKCSIEDCGKPCYGHGWCSAHYSRWKRNGHPLAGERPKGLALTCEQEGCEKQQRAQGLCGSHYWKLLKSQQPPCAVENCGTLAQARGYCPRHYQRLMKYGAPTAGPAFRRQRGTGLPKWAYWQRKDEQWQAADPELLAYVEILRSDPCSYCGGPCEHIDHIVPVNSGGGLEIENVTAACGLCNVRKAATPLLLFLQSRAASPC